MKFALMEFTSLFAMERYLVVNFLFVVITPSQTTSSKRCRQAAAHRFSEKR